MTIYTGRGDEGLTDLRDRSRVSKTNVRIEAYGVVDEANSLIGRARPTGYEDIDDWLAGVQNHLHIIQAEFSMPEADDPAIDETHVEQVESMDRHRRRGARTTNQFILPGGSDSGAALHHARSVTRRAERRAVELANNEPINAEALVYLNRLSDALFTFARLVNARDEIPEESPSY